MIKLLDILKKIYLKEEDIPSPEDAPVPAKNIPVPEEPKIEEPNTDISKLEAKNLIKTTKGKFFTVTFIKKDGSLRIMNARLGVKAYLKGGELPYNPEDKGLIPVFDVKVGGYRMVNVNTIIKLKIGDREYNVK
jgi:hypothetical protein